MNPILWWMLQTSISVIALIPLALGVCHLFQKQPTAQHVIWLLLLLKFATPPVVDWPIVPWDIRTEKPMTINRSPASPIDVETALPSTNETPIPPVPGSLTSSISSASARMTEVPPQKTSAGFPGSPSLISTVFGIWIIGGIICLIGQVRSLMRQSHFLKSATPAPAVLVEQVTAAAHRAKISPPEVILLKGIHSPFLWCLGRIRLVWPERLLTDENAHSFAGLISHELAHLQRKDHWVAWIELALSVVWWWNPAFWFVRRRLRDAAEMSCDAIASGPDLSTRKAYAQLLLELSAGMSLSHPESNLTLGIGSVTSFERRLSSILSDDVSSRLTRSGLIAIAGLAVLIVPSWSQNGQDPPAPTAQQIKVQDPGPADNATANDDQSTSTEDSETDEDDSLVDRNLPIKDVSGRVVDPDGRPVAGAKILQGTIWLQKPRVAGKTDANGQFRIKAIGYQTWLVAVAAGYGFGTPLAGDETTLKLTPETPVLGRVVDAGGKPLEGARIRVRNVDWSWQPDDPIAKLRDRDDPSRRPKTGSSSLAPWLATVRRAVNSQEYYQAKQFLIGLIEPNVLGNRPAVYERMILPVTTDADGRFTLRGLGAERVAELYIEGLPDYASSLIVVATHSFEGPIVVPYNTAELKKLVSNPSLDLSIYGPQFETALTAGRVFEGIVTDRESGKPVSGVKIIGEAITRLEYPGYDRFFTTTDKQGYYRVEGFPTGMTRTFVVDVPPTESLFGRKLNIGLKPGDGPQKIDISLARCVWITGEVYDEQTGRYASGQSIEYHVFRDNPHLKRDLAAGFLPQFGPDHQTQFTDQNGAFRIRGYPGRGIVSAGGSRDYLDGIGVDAIVGLKKDEFDKTLYDTAGFSPYIRSTTIEVNVPENADSFSCSLTLRKGKSRLLTVAWPDGKTPGPIDASGIKHQIENPMSKLSHHQFSVENLFPGETRHVVARDTAEKLTGLALVSEAEDGPLTLKLVRWATVRGRLIDDNGQPRSQGLRVRLEDYQLPIHTVNGTNYDKEDFAIDADGRFELIGLVPGAKYRLQLVEGGIFIRGNLTADIVLEVGEDRDLGNVKVAK